MKRKIRIGLLLTATLLSVSLAEAQQRKKIPRVAFLSSASPSAVSDHHDAFRRRLRELGYVEGKDIVIEYRYAEGKPDRLPELAANLVRMKVDAIIAGSNIAARAAAAATKTIPIVMSSGADPVATGLVAIHNDISNCA